MSAAWLPCQSVKKVDHLWTHELLKRKIGTKTSTLTPSFTCRRYETKSGKFWVNHFSTIGLVGMNEACVNLFDKNIASQEGQKFTERIMDFMRDKLLEYQSASGNNYNLEATPAEGTSYRLAKLDKEIYKDIVSASKSDEKEPYYTNSTQLPVDYSDDLFQVLAKQDDIQAKYTGGTVVHLYGGEQITDFSVVKNLVKKISEKHKLPYFSLTPTFSICKKHGYLSGEKKVCPKCGSDCEVYSRIVGYLRPISQWNDGKKTEYDDRKVVKYQ